MPLRYWDIPDSAVRSIGLWVNGIGRTESSEAGRQLNRKDRMNHDCQLLYVVHGEHHVVIDGETVTLRSQEGIIIPPDIVFRSYPNERMPWGNYWLHFEGPTANTLVSLMQAQASFPAALFCGSNKELACFEQIIAEFASKSPWYHAAASSLLHTVLTSILRARAERLTESSTDSLSQHGKLMMRCVNDIHEHFREDIRIQELADRIGYNRSHFTRMFTKVFGSSPRDYVLRLRLAEAKHLLLTTDEPIGTIAKSLHYGNPDSFTKHFKKTVGISPQQFRHNQGR